MSDQPEIEIPPQDPQEWDYATYHRSVICKLTQGDYTLIRESKEDSVKWQVRHYAPQPAAPHPMMIMASGETVVAICDGLEAAIAVARYHAVMQQSLALHYNDTTRLNAICDVLLEGGEKT